VLGLRDTTVRPVLRVLENWFFAMLAGVLELVCGVRIAVTAEADDALGMASIPSDSKVLLVCNHRSEVDWFFFWGLGLRLGCHDRIRVMMKAIIRHAPGVGWAMTILNFPFIKRNWATDEARITKLMSAYREYSPGVWLAMFPEGTALYDKTLQQSHDFASSRGEPQWQYVLHPRVKGFELCAKELDPDYIVDLTIAYPELVQGIRPSPVPSRSIIAV
jgi:lysocardiolipin and lysophospholipid acyltransferase